MKTKYFLIAVIVVLAVLLGLSHWQTIKLQQTLEFQNQQTIKLQQTLEFHNVGIKKMAATQAMHDLSSGIASYFVVGRISREYTDAFTARFKDYGISAHATGCDVIEAEGVYWDEYNRAVRDALKRQHGKDIIGDFDAEYRSRHQ
jgi:Tfp pilus assembly protein PilV